MIPGFEGLRWFIEGASRVAWVLLGRIGGVVIKDFPILRRGGKVRDRVPDGPPRFLGRFKKSSFHPSHGSLKAPGNVRALGFRDSVVLPILTRHPFGID